MEASRSTALVPPTGDALQRSNGRLGGLLFLVGAAVTVPATLLLHPEPPPQSYLVTLGVVLLGGGFYFAPWSRMGHAWLHVLTVSGTVAVTASLIVFSLNYRAIYFVVLAYAAYVFESRREVAAHTLLASAGLVLALFVSAGSTSAAVSNALVFVPALILVTAFIAYLNEQLAASRDAYREFAAETMELALRIRESAVGVVRDRRPIRPSREVEELSSAPLDDRPVQPRTHAALPTADQPRRP